MNRENLSIKVTFLGSRYLRDTTVKLKNLSIKVTFLGSRYLRDTTVKLKNLSIKVTFLGSRDTTVKFDCPDCANNDDLVLQWSLHSRPLRSLFRLRNTRIMDFRTQNG